MAVAAHGYFQVFAERVHAAHAHAVQTTRNFIRILVKFAPRVQHRHHHFYGGAAFFLVKIDGNPAAVVADGNRVIFVDGDFDSVAVAGQGLVNGVVHYFPHQMVQAFYPRVADVHAGSLAYGF